MYPNYTTIIRKAYGSLSLRLGEEAIYYYYGCSQKETGRIGRQINCSLQKEDLKLWSSYRVA